MPAWYLMASVGALVALIVAFKIVEAIL